MWNTNVNLSYRIINIYACFLDNKMHTNVFIEFLCYYAFFVCSHFFLRSYSGNKIVIGHSRTNVSRQSVQMYLKGKHLFIGILKIILGYHSYDKKVDTVTTYNIEYPKTFNTVYFYIIYLIST